MTRNEFIENVNYFSELIDFCYDEGCDVCESIYNEDSYNDLINESIVDWARDLSWTELKDRLEDLPTGYDYYDIYDDYEGLTDDDFDSYKDDVLSWGDDNGIWDEEDEEDEEIDDGDFDCIELEDEEDDYVEPEDGCSFEELFAASQQRFQRVTTEESDDDEAAAMIQMLMYA